MQSSFDALPAPYSQADYNLGRRTFKNCQSCHTITERGRNLVGPNLHGVFGRTVGTADGFQYSRALEAESFEWTPERLEEWLANPRDYLPGNRMTFAGVRRPADRHAVIAYLMVESGYSSGQNADQKAATDENQGTPGSEPVGERNE
ncbi:c-type cytochrome [Henriciella barbarensis]|uniref:c-type cytochrome n=1 Tax=Henriciella barbarensis TaxID=86342 RepID=UPI001F2E08B8|nr:cytochrome c family protein [Henriciella barbarensis]